MNGHFSWEISIKDQCEVFINDLNKGIFNKISMFVVDIELCSEVKYRETLKEPVWMAKHNPAGYFIPSVSLSP